MVICFLLRNFIYFVIFKFLMYFLVILFFLVFMIKLLSLIVYVNLVLDLEFLFVVVITIIKKMLCDK